MDNNKVGKFIAYLRKEKGLTQQQLGDKLFVTDKAVSKWERGLSFPDITILQKLALILDADVSEILCGERGKNKKIIYYDSFYYSNYIFDFFNKVHILSSIKYKRG